MRTQNFWKDRIDPKTGKQYKPIALCLHITDASSESTLNHIADPQSGVSYNWVIDERGKWIEVVNEKDAAWANGYVRNPTWPLYNRKINPNLQTISVGAANTGNFPKVRMWISWARGCREIIEKYNFPLDSKGIPNHFDIRIDKRCPRPWFTRKWLLTLMKFV